MRTHPRAGVLATAMIGLVVAAGVLTGCSQDSSGDRDAPATGGTGSGDVPFALVLPDSLAVSQDGQQVLADCFEGLCRWTTADGRLAQVDDGSHVAVSPDWSLIAGVGDGASVVLLDADSRDVVRELVGHTDEEGTDGSPVRDIAFSPDAAMVASAGLEGQVIVWSVEDGSEVTTIMTGTDVFAVSFSPDGRRLATAGGGPAQVFDVASGDLVATLADSSPESSGLAWSADGRWLAAAGPDAVPAVWDTQDFALVEQLDDRRLQQVAFAPDSQTLALTDTEDGTVRLWTPAALGGDAAGVRELVGHRDEPEAVVFAPDGARLYSVAGLDGIFSWDVTTGQRATKFELPER